MSTSRVVINSIDFFVYRAIKVKPALLAVLLMLLCSAPSQAAEWIYSVRPGDTMATICANNDIALDPCTQEILFRNDIKDPANLAQGTRLYLPIAWLKRQPANATVLAMRGEVYIIRASQTDAPLNDKKDSREKATLESELLVGDKVITDKGSVTLKFADGSLLILTPDSEVLLDTLSQWSENGMVDTRVRLNRGRAKARVNPLRGPNSRYEIATPAAVAAVRGTEFRVNAGIYENEPLLKTEVLEGTVGMNNGIGSKALPMGYALRASQNQPMPKPVELLPAPRLDADFPNTIQWLPTTLRWAPVKGAVYYRVEVVSEAGNVSYQQQVSKNAFTVPLLADGNYTFKVRAIDEKGFEGYDALVMSRLDEARPKSVTPTASYSGEREQKMLTWRWPKVPGTDGYKVRTRNIDTGAIQESVVEPEHNQYEQPVAATGHYEAQIAPIVEGKTLAYGEPAAVNVTDKTEVPWWMKILSGAAIVLALL